MHEISSQTLTKKSLSDIASESLILILQLRSTNDYGDASTLKSRVIDLFNRFEHEARSSGIDKEKINYAKFALTAFMDETIIGSEWDQKDTWLSEPLQITLFDTFNAGEEFFSNLSKLRERTGSNKDVLEIYYLCLTLGFKGKYQLQSPENLRRVIDDLNMELHPEMFASIDSVSVNPKPKDSIIQTAQSKIPLWIYPAAAVLISVLFYLIMSISISGKTDNIVESLKKLIV